MKNVKGQFIPIVENDAKNWLPVVYHALPEEKRAKLEKVWNLWKNTNIFAKDKLEEMGKCFYESSSKNKGDGKNDAVVDSSLEKSGLSFGVRRLFLSIVCSSSNPNVVIEKYLMYSNIAILEIFCSYDLH